MQLPRILIALTLAPLTVTAAPADAVEPPPPAHMSIERHDDGTGDVQSFSGTDPASPGVVQPSRGNGDINAIRVVHTKKTVRVLLRFVELNRGGEQQAYDFRLVTPKLERIIEIGAWKGKYAPIDRGSYWSGSKPTMYGPRYHRKKCAGMSSKIDYRANTALLVVPRRCLGNPRSVAGGARFFIATNYQTGFYDDAASSGGSLADPIATVNPAYRPGGRD